MAAAAGAMRRISQVGMVAVLAAVANACGGDASGPSCSVPSARGNDIRPTFNLLVRYQEHRGFPNPSPETPLLDINGSLTAGYDRCDRVRRVTEGPVSIMGYAISPGAHPDPALGFVSYGLFDTPSRSSWAVRPGSIQVPRIEGVSGPTSIVMQTTTPPVTDTLTPGNDDSVRVPLPRVLPEQGPNRIVRWLVEVARSGYGQPPTIVTVPVSRLTFVDGYARFNIEISQTEWAEGAYEALRYGVTLEERYRVVVRAPTAPQLSSRVGFEPLRSAVHHFAQGEQP